MSTRRKAIFCFASTLVFCAFVVSWSTVSLAATIDLVGFDLYSSTSTGASSANPVPGGYRWSSNSSEGGGIARQKVTETSPTVGSQTLAIVFPLSVGDNRFTFAPDPNYPPGGSTNPGSYAGVNLFLNDTGVSYNPIGTGIAGNLAVFAPTTGGSPPVTYPSAGTLVDDYGPGVNVTAYSGAISFTLDGLSVTVNKFSTTLANTGSMTITVTALPEPNLLALIVIVGPSLLVRRPVRDRR